MKRIWSLAVACLLFACTSTPKNSMPYQAGAKRDVAADRADTDKGAPGNFTYEYHGQLNEFIDAMFVKKFGVPVGTNEDYKFMMSLGAVREDMSLNNLHDTGVDDSSMATWQSACAKLMAKPHRTPEGQCYYYNYDPKQLGKLVGMYQVGARTQRFGRNLDTNRVNYAFANSDPNSAEMMEPNPSELSQELFTRKNGTIEVESLNTLAAAWLQAENHDWFTHGKNPPANPILVKTNDPHFPEGTIKIPQTLTDNSTTDRKGFDKAYRNYVTHWWDASHIYGSDAATIRRVRSDHTCSNEDPFQCPLLPGGHIAVDAQTRHLYYNAEGHPITGFFDNWWIGLEMIHSLFALEHNDVADALAVAYPKSKTEYAQSSQQAYDNWLFETSRMIVAALIAKIHTTEWTPAILDSKPLHVGMYTNWHGLKGLFGVSNLPWLRAELFTLDKEKSHALSGLMGTGTLAPYDVPFTLTEEFVAVYRMHPLAPEQIIPRDVDSGTALQPIDVENLIFREVPKQLPQHSSAEWMYGFGTGHPGAMVLHNYPSFLQHLHAERNMGVSAAPENTSYLDMGAVDIVRDRERGIPRYNEFRNSLRAGCVARMENEGKSADECPLKPAKSFEDLTSDPSDAALLKRLYKGDINKLDLVVGSLAENDRYNGFGFGNTAFWIFALMASRRLSSDPFFHDYYIPKVYTQLGLDWIKRETMISVIERHYPELTPRFKDVSNAFRPWQPVYDAVKAKVQASTQGN